MNKIIKNTQTKQYTIYSVVQRFFNRLGWKMVQKTCKHENKYNQWTDYQDRYHKEYCLDCKLTTYEGMD